MSEAKRFLGGIPTEPDIRKLKEEYPKDKLGIGRILTFEEVAKVIDVKVDSSRFKVVTWKWRREVEAETGQHIGCPGDKTFRIDNASQVFRVARNKTKAAVRATHRSIDLTKLVDTKELSTDESVQIKHTQNVNASILGALETCARVKPPTLQNKKRKEK